MTSDGKRTIGVFIAYSPKDCSALERYLHRRDVGCYRVTYEEAGLTYLVSQFSDHNLISDIPREIRFSFGDITRKVKDIREAHTYVAIQRDASRQQLGKTKKEILKKTNEMISKGEPLIF